MRLKGEGGSMLPVAMIMCALLIGATFASTAAAKDKVGTSGSITSGGPDGAEGKVKSSKACRKNRKVKLYMEAGDVDQLIDDAKSDKSGFWQIQAALAAGTYYIQITQRVTAQVICKGFVSKGTVL